MHFLVGCSRSWCRGVGGFLFAFSFGGSRVEVKVEGLVQVDGRLRIGTGVIVFREEKWKSVICKQSSGIKRSSCGKVH
jgi:hypothetical protein